jgi:glucose/arabinose dehydrogenase
MRARSLSRIVAGALCVAAARHAVAQSTAPSSASRLVATYHIASQNHDRTMPSLVTIADSAGHLVATYHAPADSAAHPMGVIVYGDDLVLVGETSRGVLEMVLTGQNGRTGQRDFVGRWSRGEQEGLLRGRNRS